jgi:glycosyltransferase XagB
MVGTEGISTFNLIAGYVLAVVLGVAAVLNRQHPHLAWHGLLMPLYWLLISFAAYRALWQLVSAPFWWEKTNHRPRNIVRSPPPRSSDRRT